MLTPDELRRLLDAVKGERFEDVLYLCTPVGSRIGETLTPPTLSPTPPVLKQNIHSRIFRLPP